MRSEALLHRERITGLSDCFALVASQRRRHFIRVLDAVTAVKGTAELPVELARIVAVDGNRRERASAGRSAAIRERAQPRLAGCHAAIGSQNGKRGSITQFGEVSVWGVMEP